MYSHHLLKLSNSPLLESLSLDEESEELLELELELELSDSLSMLISVMGGGAFWRVIIND